MKRINNHIIVQVLIYLYNVCIDVYFLFTDKTPQSWDQSMHLLFAIKILDQIKVGNFVGILTSTSYYSPLYYLSTFPILVLNLSPPWPILINLLYLLILQISTFKISKRIFNTQAAVLATILVSSYPWMMFQRKNYLIDFSLTALISLFLLVITRSGSFKNRIDTVYAAIVAALCLLMKPFSIFFLLPLSAVIFINKYQDVKQRKVLIKNLILFSILVGVTAGFWYLPNITNIKLGISALKTFGLIEGDPSGLFHSLMYYAKSLIHQMSPALSITAVFSLIVLFVDKKTRSIATCFSMVFIFAFVSFSIIPNKDARYILPLLIFTAVISAGGIVKIQDRFVSIGKLVSGVVVVYCLLLSLRFTFGWSVLNSISLDKPIEPETSDWKLEQIFKDIEINTGKTSVMIIPDHRYINFSTIMYYSYVYKSNIELFFPSANVESNSLYELADYTLLLLPIDSDYNQSPYSKRVNNYREYFNKVEHLYEVASTYDLPDATTLYLYRKK